LDGGQGASASTGECPRPNWARATLRPPEERERPTSFCPHRFPTVQCRVSCSDASLPLHAGRARPLHLLRTEPRTDGQRSPRSQRPGAPVPPSVIGTGGRGPDAPHSLRRARPHQHARGKPEFLHCTVGIDVGKSWLDVHVLPAGEALRVPNSAEGIRRLKRWLLGRHPKLVAVEATGKWQSCAVPQPARLPARGGADRSLIGSAQLPRRKASSPRPTGSMPASWRGLPPSWRLCASTGAASVGGIEGDDRRSRQRRWPKRTALKNQLAAATNTFLKRQFASRIKQLSVISPRSGARHSNASRPMTAWQALCHSHLDPKLRSDRRRNAHRMPGRAWNHQRQTAGSLAGLAPVADDSGQRHGVRSIWGGRAIVRKILYLAAVSASRCNADMKSLPTSHRQRKTPKTCRSSPSPESCLSSPTPSNPKPHLAAERAKTCLTANTDALPVFEPHVSWGTPSAIQHARARFIRRSRQTKPDNCSTKNHAPPLLRKFGFNLRFPPETERRSACVQQCCTEPRLSKRQT